ncbi:MAG TPA: hypothetical protein DDY31_11605 [Lachnospiraceae bacterium]|nr:hypothetical protein [Lachnospiraceae bacterium]
MGHIYEDRLNEIIARYGCVAPELVDSTLINNIIVNAFDRCCAGKKVAIWGVGKKNAVNGHCAVIINRYILNLSGLKVLVDSDKDLRGSMFLGYPVISPEEIGDYGIEVIVIASNASRKNIQKNIMRTAPQCEYIDIYEELEKAGIRINGDFFNEQNVYTELYRQRYLYEMAEDISGKEEHLRALIAYYLKIRDFYYAEYYITEYCSKQYADSEKYRDMLSEILALCKEVKEKNAGRTGDIAVHLIDSLRAMDVYGTGKNGEFCLNLFKEYQNTAAVFTEAYSTGPTTYESMIGTIKQKLSFEENIYENNHFMFDMEEFEFLDEIHKKGMPVRFYIAKDYMVMNPCEDIVMKEQLHMPEKLWTMACDMAESSAPAFYFAYYPWEVHFPMLCGYMSHEPKVKRFTDVGMEDMSGFIEQQLADCLAYVDRQFSYYKDFFSDGMTTVIMADHSQPVYDETNKNPYFMFYNDKDKVSHVTFLIADYRLKAGVYDGLISMLDFNRIMEKAVFEHKVEIPEREVVQYQFYNVQNRMLREAAKQRGLMDYTEGIQCFLSKKYLYVKTATGVREVYALPDNRTNVMGTEGAEEYVRYVEEHFDTGFPEFWTVRHGRI